MIPLKEPITNLLQQLSTVLDLLTNDQFTQRINVLSGSTVGQHTRHILEFYIELNKGYLNGVVDYDERERDHAIESSRHFATKQLQEVIASLGKSNQDLILKVNYGDAETQSVSIVTNYYRELIYNLEHTVHHMALIRIGVNAISEINIPDEFGIAASTLKFRQACAQ